MDILPLNKPPKYLSKFPVRVSTQAVRDRTIFHFHQHIQFCFVLSGELKHTINEFEYTQKAGSCAFLLPYIPHSFSSIESEDTPLLVHIWLSPDFLINCGYDFFAFGKDTTHFEKLAIPEIFSFENSKEASRKIVYKLISEFDQKTEMSYAKMASLIAELFRLACHDSKKVKITEPFRRQVEGVNCAVAYIEENFKNKICIDDLCDIANTSRRSFTKNFRKVTGLSPTEFIITTRLSYATELLAGTERIYDDIAKESGLYNASNLARVLSKYTGMAPMKFRKQAINDARQSYRFANKLRFEWLDEI